MFLQDMAVIVLACFAVFCVLAEFARHRDVPFDFFFFFNVSYLIYFVIAPLHLLLGGEDFTFFPEYLLPVVATDDAWFFVGYTAVIVGVWLLVAAGFRVGQRRRGGQYATVPVLPVRDQAVFAVALTGLGLASVYVFAAQFGGIEFALRNASFIRGRAVASDSSLLFLRNIAMFLPAASLLVLAMTIDAFFGRARYRYVVLAALGGVFALALIALALQGSRRAFLIFFAGAVLFIANYRRRMYAVQIGAIAVIGIVYVAIGDLLNRGLDQGFDFVLAGVQSYWEQGLYLTYAAIWRDFSLPVVESWAVLTKFEDTPRMFIDVPIGVVELVPERLLPIPLPERLSDHSTLLIGGQGADVIAEIPPGFIGFFWYSAYWPGLIVGPWLFGFLGGFLHGRMLPARGAPACRFLAYTLAGFVWAYFLREGIPYMLFVERFHWFVLIIGLVVLGRLAHLNSTVALAGSGRVQPT